MVFYIGFVEPECEAEIHISLVVAMARMGYRRACVLIFFCSCCMARMGLIIFLFIPVR